MQDAPCRLPIATDLAVRVPGNCEAVLDAVSQSVDALKSPVGIALLGISAEGHSVKQVSPLAMVIPQGANVNGIHASVNGIPIQPGFIRQLGHTLHIRAM